MATPRRRSPVLPPGKLPAALLADLLAGLPRTDGDVLIGPGVGEDAAAVRLGGRTLVVASDPITFAGEEIGWYAVHVNANDVAACGVAPRWFLATLLLPEGAAPALPATILAQIVAACREVGASLIGGHTEVTPGLTRPLVIGVMLGEAAPGGPLASAAARPGDALLLTSGLAIEGTALIASELAAEVEARFGADFAGRCREYLHRPGLSVLPAARAATAAGARALHDPTEGGLASALHELADAAGCGVWLEAEAVPIYAETRRLCEHFGLDPLGLLASGALLIAADPSAREGVLAALAAADIPAATIGRLTPAAEGRRLRRGGREEPLPHFERDEVTRLLR